MNKEIEVITEETNQAFIRKITQKIILENGYERIKMEFANGNTLRINSKFNSDTVVEYALKNNHVDLECFGKYNLPNNSTIDLELTIETFGNYGYNKIKEPMKTMHMCSSNMRINQSNKEIDLDYLYDLEENITGYPSRKCINDSFHFVYDDNVKVVALYEYPNELVNTIDEAIKESIKLYKTITNYNAKCGITDYNFSIWLNAHEM